MPESGPFTVIFAPTKHRKHGVRTNSGARQRRNRGDDPLRTSAVVVPLRVRVGLVRHLPHGLVAMDTALVRTQWSSIANEMNSTRREAPTHGEVLPRTLRPRHIQRISIGGIIGAGLFVGSGAAIAAVGPAVIISYFVAGLVILLIMRMLSEMAAANLGLSSFTEYTRLGLGHWAGFMSGWLYWYFWVVVVAVEAIAGASIIAQWIHLPVWEIGLVLMLGLT